MSNINCGIGVLHVKRRLRRSRVHSLWLLVDHCVLRNWDRILVRAVKGLISRAGMVSICPLLWQRDVKLQQTNMLNVKYWRIFLWRHLSLKFLLFQLIGHTKRCLQKNILKIVYGSVFVIWLYLQKAMYRPCDIDLWPMKLIATLLVSCMNFRSISLLIAEK